MKINNTIFLNYLLCPYKAGLLLNHQSASPTAYQALAKDTARRYELLAREAISRSSPDVVLSPDHGRVVSLLQQGPSLILDATIEIGDFEFHFDALKRWSPTQYLPILFHHGNVVPAFQELLLAFGGYVLHLLEQRYPTTGIVVYGARCSARSVCLTSKYRKVELIVAALAAKQQVPLILNKNCRNASCI